MSSEQEFKNAVAESMGGEPSDVLSLDASVATAELVEMGFCSGLTKRLLEEFPNEFQNYQFFRWKPCFGSAKMSETELSVSYAGTGCG